MGGGDGESTRLGHADDGTVSNEGVASQMAFEKGSDKDGCLVFKSIATGPHRARGGGRRGAISAGIGVVGWWLRVCIASVEVGGLGAGY